jgi:hypothetical protein
MSDCERDRTTRTLCTSRSPLEEALMKTSQRWLALGGAVLALGAALPAATAFAKHGADDRLGHVRHSHVRHSHAQHSHVQPADTRHGGGADDGVNQGGGADDGPDHR